MCFQGFARGKISVSFRPAPTASRGAATLRGGRCRLGQGGEPRAREAVIAVELARKFDHSIHRLKIALHHHGACDDHRLAEPGDL